MRLEYPARTLVVCHDAGAANVIIAGLLNTGRDDWLAVMGGPARKLWLNAFPDNVLIESLDEVLPSSEMVLTGTGWGSCLEHDARRGALKYGVKSIAVVDHWVNYQERFTRNEETIYPDEIWVTDSYALAIANRLFPSKLIIQIQNLYLNRQLQTIRRVVPSVRPELLYVLEPARTVWGRDRPGEFQALDYFVQKFPVLELPKDAVVRLRPHPSDWVGKYDEWLKSNASFSASLDVSLDIAESIGRASWVVGCESFALVLGLMSGRTVYCSLPPSAPVCRLPHKGIISLKEL